MNDRPGTMKLCARAMKSTAVVLLAVWVTACAVPVPPPTFPELTFSHLPPIRLNVAEIEIVENYVPPLRAPHVEHNFPVTPLAAMRRWAVDRIQAGGETRRGQVIIEDARVVAVPLPVRKGLQGLFYKEQEVRYDATLEARIEVRAERGYRDSYATARILRSRTVPEEMTLIEREQLFFDLTEELMRELNTELEANIRRHMQRDLL